MADPMEGLDVHGLAELVRRWTPKGLKNGSQDAKDLLDAWADMNADVFNLLMEFEDYLPIIWNPTRCLVNDLDNILEMNGVQTSKSLSEVQKRRLAILGPFMKEWRGSFRSFRSVAGALTGASPFTRTWLMMRVVMDESTVDLIIMDSSFADVTQMFVLGQGPSATYNADQVQFYLTTLAVPILDSVELVDCFAVTRWRDGFGGWVSLGEPELVISDVVGEYEAVDLGPDVDGAAPVSALAAPTQKDPLTGDTQTLWGTVFFETIDAPDDAHWDFHLYASDTDPTVGTFDSYLVRVPVGNHMVKLYRVVNGVETLIDEFLAYVPDGEGDYHRVDFLVSKNATNTKVRAYVDNVASAWYVDPTLASRPNGVETVVAVKQSLFASGKLRVAAITAREQD